MTSCKDICKEAADYIREHGWCRGESSSDGKVCILGALGAVLSVRRRLDLIDPIADNLASKANTSHLFKWNDDLNRTVDDVLNLLENAYE